MGKEYEVRVAVLYPLDESGVTTIVPADAPHKPKPARKREPLRKWRKLASIEKQISSSQLSGDEWLDEKGDWSL